MLKTRIIPCLDVANGRVVKGVNFVDIVDAGDPVESAIRYNDMGADELCFLDIMATEENRGTMYDLATRTAEACFMPLTIGGGVRSHEDVRKLLLALGMVRSDLATLGQALEVEAYGERLKAEVRRDGALWDPKNERIRA